MVKKIEWRVVCPHCGHHQAYHSHNSEVEGKRRKNCNKCDSSFNAKKHRLSNLPKQKKKLKEEHEEKGEGFFKYSKSD